MAFTDVIDNIVTVLEDADGAFQTYCTTNFGRAALIKQTYVDRAEISEADLPLVSIALPGIDKDKVLNTKDKTYTLNLWIYFLQNDPYAALGNFTALDELVDEALLADHTRGGYAINTIPGPAQTDGGVDHPVYTILQETQIRYRKA